METMLAPAAAASGGKVSGPSVVQRPGLQPSHGQAGPQLLPQPGHRLPAQGRLGGAGPGLQVSLAPLSRLTALTRLRFTEQSHIAREGRKRPAMSTVTYLSYYFQCNKASNWQILEHL